MPKGNARNWSTWRKRLDSGAMLRIVGDASKDSGRDHFTFFMASSNFIGRYFLELDTF